MYYEPLARVVPSLSDILEGPPVKKLLFMTDAARIDATLRPHWKVRKVLCPCQECGSGITYLADQQVQLVSAEGPLI